MAKPLPERQCAALQPLARLADVRTVIEATEAAIADLTPVIAAHAANALDPAQTPAAAREARTARAEAEFERDRHNAALASLGDKLRAMMADQAAQRRTAAYDEAEAGRDRLAADLRDRWPALCDEIVAFLRRLAASDEQLRTVNADLPRGKSPLKDAETTARRLEGHYHNNAPILRLAQIRLPSISGPDLLWPLPRIVPEYDYGAAIRKAEAGRAADESDAARWKRYRIVNENDDDQPIHYTRKPVPGQPDRVWFTHDRIDWLDEAEAGRLGALPGVAVTLVEPRRRGAADPWWHL